MASKKSKKQPKKTKNPRFAIIVSEFNPEVTDGLLKGSIQYLNENGIAPRTEDVYRAPGAFEIPLIARNLARKKHYDGVICLGCVIKGDTAHFEFISLGATIGLIQGTLETEKPISFGILTTYNDEQAWLRSSDNASNKGREAAAACLKTWEVLGRIRGDDKL